MPAELRPILYGILMWAVCFYAFRRGGRDERLAVVGIILNSYLTLLVVSPVAVRFRHVELPIVVVDFALLLLLQFIALRSRKFWPLWLAAMQAVAMMAHFAPLMPHMLPAAYANASALWSYPMLTVLALAVRRHPARRLPAMPAEFCHP